MIPGEPLHTATGDQSTQTATVAIRFMNPIFVLEPKNVFTFFTEAVRGTSAAQSCLSFFRIVFMYGPEQVSMKMRTGPSADEVKRKLAEKLSVPNEIYGLAACTEKSVFEVVAEDEDFTAMTTLRWARIILDAYNEFWEVSPVKYGNVTEKRRHPNVLDAADVV
ncbi:hypothetical protein TruAng_002659 [Truncatella angustata]|nr:hypothetical protein TruAng_002659 [Truncatella angustata]